MSQNNEIAILDFGSQYTHLIARRIRELGVVSRIYTNDITSEKLQNAAGIILSGGPNSIKGEQKLGYDTKMFDLNIPILGICYGHHLIANFFNGKIESGQTREYGLTEIKTNHSPIFKNTKHETTVWMSHGDNVAELPPGFISIASSKNDPITAMANETKKIYSFQFHPEVHHTEQGKQMLDNFVFNICKAEKNWNTNTMLEQIQQQIRNQAGDKNIFLLLSGGVDSTVCFALLEKTLGKDRVYGLHIDHGLMRLNESQEVNLALKQIGLDDLHFYNAEDEYLQALEGVADPEKKRKIIGDLFLDIADRVMSENNMTNDKWLLGQGTIYPDTIESGGTKNADLIKTHHNRVPRVQQMIAEGKIIEPIKELYKDEVRQIGLNLGLPAKLIYRHPFPGPGLGIRCLCNVIASEALQSRVLCMSLRGVPIRIGTTWQSRGAKATLNPRDCDASLAMTFYQLPIKSVGVQGDQRSYAHPALITSTNQIINWQTLKTISPQITNSNPNINRVLFQISGNPKKIKQSTLKKAFLTKDRLNLLRQIDSIVNKNILSCPQCTHIWQLPVVLIPFGYNKKESIVLRPVESEEAMTVSFAKIPDTTLKKIIEEIEVLDAIDFIFYDVTNKPPGTIEWE